MQLRRKTRTTLPPEFEAGPSFRETRTRSRKLVIAGIALALCAGLGSYVLITRAQQSAAATRETPRVSAVVAARTIAARQAVGPDDLAVRDVPVDATNAQGTFQSVDQVVGRISGVAILQGQLVTSNLFAFSAGAGGVAILSAGESISPDSPIWRAVSLSVPDERAVGGQLTAGEHVDVFVTANIQVNESVASGGTLYADKATKVTYQDVPILSKAGPLYVIKVTERVGEEIAHLQASGGAQFSLALRPDSDSRPVDASTLGATTNIIIQRYGLPVPQVFPQPGQAVNVGPDPNGPVPNPSNLAVAASPAPTSTP